MRGLFCKHCGATFDGEYIEQRNGYDIYQCYECEGLNSILADYECADYPDDNGDYDADDKGC